MKHPQCYFFFGQDAYRVSQAVKAVKTRFLAQAAGLANLTRWDMTEVTMETVRPALLALPFLAPHRLFILRQALQAPQAVQEGLIETLPQLGPSTIVVVAHFGSVDKRLRLTRWLLAKAKSQAFPLPNEDQLRPWLARLAKKWGVALDPVASLLLARSYPQDTWRLAQETRKLAQYALAGGRGVISPDDVALLCVGAPAASAWQLADALRATDLAQAMGIITRLLEQEDPLLIMGALAGQLRALAKTVLARRLGLTTPQAIARRTNLHPYTVTLSRPLAAKLNLPTIQASYGDLVALDRRVKEGQLSPRLAVLLLTICLTERWRGDSPVLPPWPAMVK